jgi:hypothetical protein
MRNYGDSAFNPAAPIGASAVAISARTPNLPFPH